MGWAHRYKPASGIPAKGVGKPWSGPIPRYEGPLIGVTFAHKPQPPPEHKSIGKMEAKEFREKLRERLDKVLRTYDRALDNDNPEPGLKAADAITKRLFGDYKQTVETQADSRTDDEIRADIERRRKELGL